MDLFFIFIWIIITLSTGTLSVVLGRRFGPAFPIAITAGLMGITGALVTKLVVAGPYIASSAVIAFSMSFLMTDLIGELWGKKQSLIAVWAALFTSVIFTISTQIAIAWPASEYALAQGEAFELLFSPIPRLLIGGFLAFVVSQHLDIFLFHKIKNYTGDRHLWLRNNGSTVISQLVDTTIVMTIGFYGIVPLVPLILGSWLVKLAIALIDTPFIYAGKYLFNRLPDPKNP